MDKKPIIIQGAMDIEIEYLKSMLNDIQECIIDNYIFYKGNINNYPVIISKTEMGMVNATIATTLGVKMFAPCLIINQGLAGSHRENIHIGDIIIGKCASYINCFETIKMNFNEGISPYNWKFKGIRLSNMEKIDLLESNLELFNHFIKEKEENICEGIIGSGDVFNKEVDRINQVVSRFNTLCEDMETSAVYTVCYRTNTKVLGVRIISNNEMTDEKLDESVAIDCQKFVYNKIVKLIDKIEEIK